MNHCSLCENSTRTEVLLDSGLFKLFASLITLYSSFTSFPHHLSPRKPQTQHQPSQIMAEQQEVISPATEPKDAVRLSRISRFTEEDLDLLTDFVPPQIERQTQAKAAPKPKKWKAAKSKIKTIALSCWSFLGVSLFYVGAFLKVIVCG